MDIEKAREITRRCVESSMSVVMGGPYVDLPADCTLEEMLEANRLVSENRETPGEDGATNVAMTVDPRGIALHYAFEHYEKDPREVLRALGFELKDEE